jgi:S1-C subfamily serine protease
MEKSVVIFGSALGATIVLIIFVFVISPPVNISPPTPELVVSNGHDVSIVGEITPIPTKKDLSLIEIFERSEASVVRVNVQRDIQVLSTTGVGSGFIYDTNGHLITNSHVIENAQKIVVTLLDGSSYNAEIIGDDPFTDLAVIKIETNGVFLQPLPIGDSSKLKVGEQIAAIGNPFGLSGSMTAGIVSQLGRLLPSQDSGFSIPDVIQTDAAINPGNSGGPLLNMRGEMVGINTAIQSGTGEFTGVGFAIPSRTVAKIVPSLIQDGEYTHPWLGISGRDIDPDLAKLLNLKDAKGFLIVTVVDNSPASKAGLHGATETKEIDGASYALGGDVILKVDGNEVRKIDDILIHLQREKSVGDEMILEILRDDIISEFTLLLEQRPNSN